MKKIVAALIVVGIFWPTAPALAGVPERRVSRWIRHYRVEHLSPPLWRTSTLNRVAENNSRRMAAEHRLITVEGIANAVGWSSGRLLAICRQWASKPLIGSIILADWYAHMGVGVVRRGGRWWVTVTFR